MSDPPAPRRRRLRPAESATSEREPSSPISDRGTPDRGASDRGPASPPGGSRSNVIWALVAGLAIGFAAGREVYRLGGSGSQSSADPASTSFIAAEGAAAPGKVYAKMADFPAGWTKDTDLGPAGAPLAGLDDAQKTTVMQALNERNCECGCPFGKLANCLQKDPNCPRSPAILKLAVDLVKKGKPLGEILAAIDAKQADMGGGGKKPAAPAADQPAGPPRRVELAAWNPRKGAKAAKVTIVEFSDFQ